MAIALVLSIGPRGMAQTPENPEIAALLEQGAKILADRDAKSGKLHKACKRFEEARKLSEGPCAPCELGLAVAYNRLGNYAGALQSAERVLETSEDPTDLGLAHNERAMALYLRAGRPGHRKLDEMEAELRKALEVLPEASPSRNSILLNLAAALEWQGRLDEALALIQPAEAPVEVAEGKGEEESSVDDGDREIKPPVKVYTPQPQYNTLARTRRTQGVVQLQAIINAEGTVDRVHVLKPLQGLTASAVEAIRRWRFEPAQIDGKPAKVYYNLTVNFSL
jgi:TonB family protein